MGYFDGNTLARALQGVRNIGMEHIARTEADAERARQTQQDTLRTQLLQSQVADADLARTHETQGRRSVEAFISSRPNLDPQTAQMLRDNPSALERYLSTNIFPTPRAAVQPGQDDLEGFVLQQMGPGADLNGAVTSAIRAHPEAEAGIRAAGERIRSRRASEGRASTNFNERDTGQETTTARNGVTGAARRHFQTFPTTPQAVNSVVQTLTAQYGGKLTQDEISGLVVAAAQQAQDQARQNKGGRRLLTSTDSTRAALPSNQGSGDPEVDSIMKLMRPPSK